MFAVIRALKAVSRNLLRKLWVYRLDGKRSRIVPENDPLLKLRGSGKQLWSDEHADDYVQRLRET
jgi:hypothetical protein